MKVALVIGAYRSGRCGVGDYTICLAKALAAIGIDAQVITSGDWSLPRVFSTFRSLHTRNFDIVHIQYPTAGFGTQLGPQALSLVQSCVTTIHEATQRHVLRKLSLLPFTVRPQHLIFTSRFERRFALSWAPWIAGRSSVIPVGSNIPSVAPYAPRTLTDIVHFGLVMPKKGLEEVLALGRLVKESKLPVSIHIVGAVPPGQGGYFDMLRSVSADLPVVWHECVSEQQVAEKLVGSTFAYFPFPDGASDRRTTLKAALQSGLVVLTTRGVHTPRPLEKVVRFCRDPREALSTIRVLMDDRQRLSEISSRAVQYARRFSFEHIAKLHLRVYGSVARNERSATERHPPKRASGGHHSTASGARI